MSAHSHTHDAAAWSSWATTTLSTAGHRSGAARGAVVKLLARKDCCLSAIEIGDELRADDARVGLASVYRALELLHELGLVTRVDVGDGTARYERAHRDGAHHHHVVCRDCGSVEAFDDTPLERAIEELAARLAFAVDGHDVVLHGRCPRCQQAA